MIAGGILLAAWAVLAVLSGGIDLGDGLAARGATAAMLRNLLTIVTGTFDESHRQPPWVIPRPDAG